ncbi:putative late blight resistance protein homolog R1B-23 [Salvia splendens]|uniref:putative late blight resistance protein homolog R1B-23 n=1 Tax=Salvia splendens TaxID=180675 RepID=UPI001C25BF25|nr:putative late blight resistance protein homolog R1B-23 [Salvia splendens]
MNFIGMLQDAYSYEFKSETFLQEFVEGYKSPYAEGDEAVPLEMRIADAVYAAEDVIEYHIVEQLRPGGLVLYEALRNVIEDMDSVVAVKEETHAYLRKDMDLDLIKKDMMEIIAIKDQLEIQVSAASVGSSTSADFHFMRVCRRLSSTTMVGFEDVMLQLMEKLVYGKPGCQVIPIVGMGGIGKTTLATNVYEKTANSCHFDICAWDTISQQYNIEQLLCEILSQANKQGSSQMSEDEIGLALHKCLSFRRLLNLGSKLDSSYGLEMKFMNEESSWNLFCKIVFSGKSCPSELVKIGKKIVECCRGLPLLSIVVIGGLVEKLEQTKECWESIRGSLNSLVNLENDMHCLKIQKLKSLSCYLLSRCDLS